MNGFFDVREYEQADSTNDIVKTAAKQGANEGFTAVAKRQTSGRGRMGRDFFSPEGGLYMSVLLKPAIKPEKAVSITTMAAVAVCEAIEDYSGKNAGIKWVNDVIVGGRKVCGILTESAASSETKLDYAVLGMGINIVSPAEGFPDDIKNKAGALFAGECPPDARGEILKRVLDRLYYHYTRLDSGEYAQQYAKRLIIVGREAEIISPAKPLVKVRVLGVDGDCALLVEYENGEKGKLTSGEVSVSYAYE